MAKKSDPKKLVFETTPPTTVEEEIVKGRPYPMSVDEWFQKNEPFVEMAKSINNSYLIILRYCHYRKIPAPVKSDLWVLDPHQNPKTICDVLDKRHRN